MSIPTGTPITLRVWESDCGVPSIDPLSLQLIMLLKINKANVIIQHAYLPQWLEIPSIQFNNTTVSNKSELLSSALSLCHPTTDAKLEIGLQSRLKAYEKYFMECFADAFYFDCWLNDANYEHAIKTWYNNVIPFPFSYFYLKKMREIARQRYVSLQGTRDQETYNTQLLAIATRCLEDFASLLGDGRLYFFGEFPTSLDITIYSYLAVALHIPLPDSQLQNLVKNHHLLDRFVRNLTQLYFPHLTTQFKYVEPVNSSNDRASNKSLIIAGFCATAAMFVYACSVGLIKPKFSNLRYFNIFS